MMTTPSDQKVMTASKKYRWLIIILFFAMLLLGVVFLQLTESYIEDLRELSQKSPDQAMDKTAFLLVFISMMAGFPAVGMGTYLIYNGNQIRTSRQFPSPGTRVSVDTPIVEGPRAVLRGRLLMVCGGLIVISGLALPIVAWWLTENL